MWTSYTSRLLKVIVWQTDRQTRPKLYTTQLRGWSKSYWRRVPIQQSFINESRNCEHIWWATCCVRRWCSVGCCCCCKSIPLCSDAMRLTLMALIPLCRHATTAARRRPDLWRMRAWHFGHRKHPSTKHNTAKSETPGKFDEVRGVTTGAVLDRISINY